MMEAADPRARRESTGDRSESSGGATGEGHFSSYLQSVAQVSGLVTVVAATIYALGVFTLVLPISSNYNSTFPAAWYAVSVVPNTVVAGHGIKSLIWPSLVLTLATTFFAMTVLWAWHVVLIGWRHVKLTASKPALSLSIMAFIYAILSAVALSAIVAVSIAVLGEDWDDKNITWLDTAVAGKIVDNVFALGTYLSIALLVLTCALAGVFSVARLLRYGRQLIRTREFPHTSFGNLAWNLISRGIAFTGLFSVFLAGLTFLLDPAISGILEPLQEFLTTVMLVFLALFLLLCLVAAGVLTLRVLRYVMKSVIFAIKTKNLPSPSVWFGNLRGSMTQFTRTYSPTLLYSGALFSVLWLAVSFAGSNLELLVIPLVDDISMDMKTRSWLDECFVPLLVLGACVSWALMYWKDWKGSHNHYAYSLEQGDWKLAVKTLLKDLRSRSVGRGFFLSLGVAYLIALCSAFLLAHLSSPPLPRVEVNALVQSKSSQAPDLQGKTMTLLAHTDGYWYLVDNEAGVLLVIPDQDDKFVRLRLGE